VTGDPHDPGEAMRAAVAEIFGPPELLRVRRWPRPEPGPGELLVRVSAAGVNPVDASNRADGSWAQITPPFIVGSDASGVVMEVGQGVDAFAVGDPVFYFSPFLDTSGGSCAEYQVVAADIVAPKPRALSHVESAAFPLAGGTAYELVVRRLAISDGERVLIHGAAGGVGGYAVQLAKHAGAHVVAVASASNEPYLQSLGADLVIDYRTTDVPSAVAATVGEVDAVVDLVGGDVVASSLGLLRERGRVASACGLTGDFELAVDKNQTLHGVLVHPDAARLRALGELVEQGALHPPPLELFSLDDIVAAHARIERGHGRGKVVIDIDGTGEKPASAPGRDAARATPGWMASRAVHGTQPRARVDLREALRQKTPRSV
jgi:NADPH:quinone reductase